MITGDNFLPESLRGAESYYFSRHSNIWGWATWRRGWKHYDVAMKTFPEFKKDGRIQKIWKDPHVAEHWMRIFDRVYRNKIDTWDYQWVYAMWHNQGFEAVPRANLVSNIGFDKRATHTKRENEPLSNLPTEEMVFPLIHPMSVVVNMQTDEYINRHVLEIKKPHEKKSILKKLWTTSPQALYTKVRNSLHIRRTGDSATRVVEVKSGYAKGAKLLMPSDIPVSFVSMVEGTYEESVIKKLQEHTSLEGKTVWDVGAHFGYQSFSFASAVGTTGKVVAFEPNPHNVETFKKNLKLNPSLAERITLFEYALSDTNEALSFNISKSPYDSTTAGGHLSSVTPPLPDSSYIDFSTIKIKAITSDTLISENTVLPPDIMKIDVEGAELQVLTGALQLLKSRKPILVIEIHSLLMMFYIQELLKNSSYALKIIDEEEERFTKTILALPQAV